MNRNKELDFIAIEENITILETDCPKSGSISFMAESGNCYIGINSEEMTEAEQAVHKAHELGHCVKGAFYNRYSSFDIISKHEYTADKYAIKTLVPKDELLRAFKTSTQIWELAEIFGVTEDFMIKACEFYGYYHRAC